MKKIALILLLTAGFSLAEASDEPPAPLPLVVAESEAFEIVGRIDDGQLVLYVDRAPSNEPVLAASLEVDAGGRSVAAAFDAASATYRISDAAWLQALAAPGRYPLAFTLIAGDDSDLLSGELVVETAAAAALPVVSRAWLLLPLLLALLAAGLFWRRRQMKGGAA